MDNNTQNYFPTNNIYNYSHPNYDYGSFNEFAAPGQQFPSQPYHDPCTNFWCDACERGFPNKTILRKHINEQHGNKSRSTNTPEDIAKWINDRKRKYPSTENVIKRQKIKEEKKKRGEVLTSNSLRKNNRQGHNNNKTGLKTGPKKYNKRAPRHKKLKIANHEVLENISKENWKGDLPPFPGTKTLFQDESSNEEEDDLCESDDNIQNEDDDKFSDDEWKEQVAEPVESIPIKNALGMLMSNYSCSSDEEDNDNQISKNKTMQENKSVVVQQIKNTVDDKQNTSLNVNENLNIPLSTHESDDEPPVEQPIIHACNDLNQTCDNVDSNKTTADIMKDDTKETEKAEGTSRRRKRHHKNNSEPNSKKDNTVKEYNKPKKVYRKETLLEMLLRNEIRHERNILLQCVKYIVDSDFFGLNNNKTIQKTDSPEKCSDTNEQKS
ncbi:nuclear fragile X mental retardation-interacting protein 1 [Ctenocephalides felis]|uniref:nuclear fragile X mental retardation-interacting protein 1 n=1 Tax=Ctenocephalides felis TaxID=7515 RepID=UPI000E6E4DAA|nr:nuclear fragile X mental retardation-interacting protein 1 [Ctenocephalides felis]